jgi:hypothetical protein
VVAAQGAVERLKAIDMSVHGDDEVGRIVEGWNPLPEWLLDRRNIVHASVKDFLQMIVALTVAMDGNQPHLRLRMIEALCRDSAFSVAAMLPLLETFVEQLPDRAPLRMAAMPLLDELKADDNVKCWS